MPPSDPFAHIPLVLRFLRSPADLVTRPLKVTDREVADSGPRLTSTGGDVGSIRLPLFEILSHEYVGLVISEPYGDDWLRLVRRLNGLDSSPALKIHSKIFGRRLLSTDLAHEDLFDSTVMDYVSRTGVPLPHVADLLKPIHLSSDIYLADLAATSRLELDLSIIRHSDAEIAAFSTSGLDPSGRRRVGELVQSMLPRCSVINLLSSSSYELERSLNLYTRFIHCGA